MAFTFAHPAIILPLRKLSKRWFSLTGLIIGSIAPDFEYFFRMETNSQFSHSLPAILYFNLPLSLILAFLFHLIIKNPLIDHLPGQLYQRFAYFKAFKWTAYFKKHYIVVIYSIMIGAFSHIVWDSFTYNGGFFASLFGLDQFKFFSFPLPRIIQHASTIVGFAYMAMVIYKMEKTTAPRTYTSRPFNWNYWLTVGFSILVVMFLQVKLQGGSLNNRDIVVGLINGMLIGLLISSFINKKTDKLMPK